MRHWSQLATRNWPAKPVRTIGVLLAIALGTAAVVWVTCCFESVRRTVTNWAGQYVGKSQIAIESPLGKYDTLPQRLVEAVAALDEVQSVTPRLVQRLRGQPMPRATLAAEGDRPRRWTNLNPEVDMVGIDLAAEQGVTDYPIRSGRMLRDEDEMACVAETSFAKEHGVDVGDALLVWGNSRGDEDPYILEIVGLMDRRRIARLQKGLVLVRLPTLQQINVKQGLITSLFVVVKDSSTGGVQAADEKIRVEVRKKAANASVRNVKLRMQQIENAQSQQEFVLVLLSCVAMLTALFIILSTLSMGMIERISQLGLMRCVGVTGWQLAALVLIEVIPLGVVGVLFGIPIGLGLTSLTVLLVPEYVGTFPFSWSDFRHAASDGFLPFIQTLWSTLWNTGIVLAASAGMVTVLVAAILPMIAAMGVSPLEASRPRGRQPRRRLLVIAGLVAIAALAVQIAVVAGVPEPMRPYVEPAAKALRHWTGVEVGVHGLQRSPRFLVASTVAIVLLYLGYALLAPLVVWLIGTPVVAATAALTRVRMRLLQDQIGHAVWRSAGICCGLMVGLSLIVGLVVFSESVRSGWQFPKKFPEAYIWSFSQMRGDASAIVAATPGVKDFTTANAINCFVEEKPMFMEKVYWSVTWFMGIEPDSFFRLLKMEFAEGDEESARKLMNEGGYVLVAEDFARTRNKHLGDSVKVFVGQQQRSFKIAGVVQSPALDIAAGYFQAQSEMNVVAVGSVMGTNADLKKHFGVDDSRLVLMNLDDPPGEGTRTQREARLLANLANELDAPQAYHGTARELKDEIDRELTRVTRLLTAVPAVALIVAAIGVANLMTANVASRAKQLAILRAVGATRGLVLRMVIGEALVLGLLGSALGLALGLHLAANTTTMTARMWGYAAKLDMPWGYLAAAIGLTVGLCILAGVLPARHASRTNIVDALHVA